MPCAAAVLCLWFTVVLCSPGRSTARQRFRRTGRWVRAPVYLETNDSELSPSGDVIIVGLKEVGGFVQKKKKEVGGWVGEDETSEVQLVPFAFVFLASCEIPQADRKSVV